MDRASHTHQVTESRVRVATGSVDLEGNLSMPDGAVGAILFAHGSGTSRHSPRNLFVARQLNEAGLGTLLIDLLTEKEELLEARTRHLRFDINFLAERLVDAVDWLKSHDSTRLLNIGCFGASTGAGAALVAAARCPEEVRAVVSRGGRPDLAERALEQVEAPTLLIVGGADFPVIELNADAYHRMRCEKRMEIVPGATHLFEEPGALEKVAHLARDWFLRHLS